MRCLCNARKMGARVNVSRLTIMRWSREGKIPRVCPTKRTILFDPDDVIAALKEREAVSA